MHRCKDADVKRTGDDDHGLCVGVCSPLGMKSCKIRVLAGTAMYLAAHPLLYHCGGFNTRPQGSPSNRYVTWL